MTIKMPRNLMTAISVVAFAVMLNGCGGGGGSSPTMYGRHHYGRHHPSDDDHGPDHSVWNYVDIAARPWTSRGHPQSQDG